MIWLLLSCTGEPDACNAIWFADTDGDGFGGDAVVFTGCDPGDGFHATADDCDDLDPDVHPDALETCNGVDDDCSGAIDDDSDPASWTDWYVDADDDGFGTGDALSACEAPAGHTTTAGDCDDDDASLSPDTRWYADRDDDGYGDATSYRIECEASTGHVADDADCDDLDDTVNPDGDEVCDGADNDCDGLTDADDDSLDTSTNPTWYPDEDGDGWADESGEPVVQCLNPGDHATELGDCDDTDPAVSPGAEEVCSDGLDNDCSGDAPECGWYGELDPDEADVSFSGGASYGYFGDEVAIADLDGDGLGDVLVGEYYASESASKGGAVHVFLGPSTGGSTADVVLSGGVAQDYLGGGLGVGDLDGDGADDLVAGAYGNDDGGEYAGAAVWLYGATSVSSTTHEGLPSVLGDTSNDYLGRTVRGLGDIDGDGFDDIGVGAANADHAATNGGTVYLFLGDASRRTGTGAAQDEADHLISGTGAYDYVGYRDTLAPLGDLDGDGLDDVGIGAYGANDDDGLMFVRYGGDSWGPTTDDLDAVVVGSARLAYTGADAGDVDGDGHLDLVMPQYSADGGGTVLVHLGDGARWSGSIDVDDGELRLEHEFSGDGFGHGTATPDLNGDGQDDLFVGAPYFDNADTESTGAIYGFYGPLSPGTWTGSSADLRIAGSSYAYLGYLDALATGDVDGDGLDDLLAGARYANGYNGGAYLFRGEGL
ncbi:MAG: hypothetical protein GY913_07250 [Proteobacteria bacterium]|nr:hypothetical protein [Pseudomonadota bacterium]MCP4916705.1 hypothetical protein [Pseudomonadota bacterium]